MSALPPIADVEREGLGWTMSQYSGHTPGPWWEGSILDSEPLKPRRLKESGGEYAWNPGFTKLHVIKKEDSDYKTALTTIILAHKTFAQEVIDSQQKEIQELENKLSDI